MTTKPKTPKQVQEWKLVAQRRRVSLAECPVGLFRYGDKGSLALKSEYGTNEGRIDAYIVSSGEFFWGAWPQSIESQRAQMVHPVKLIPVLPKPKGKRK